MNIARVEYYFAEARVSDHPRTALLVPSRDRTRREALGEAFVADVGLTDADVDALFGRSDPAAVLDAS